MSRGLLFFCCVLLLSGCGLKLSPVLAGFESGLTAASGPEMEAAVGDAVLSYADRFLQPAFSPRTSVTPPTVLGQSLGSMSRDQVWINWWQLSDGTLVLQPPPGYADGLGLRVDNEGKVVGRRPWIDVRRGVRPSQGNWEGRLRHVFSPVKANELDLFLNELVYVGVKNNHAVFEHRMRKVGGGLIEAPSIRHFEVDGIVDFKGVVVKIFEADSRSLRYRIILPQPERP